MRNIKQKVKFNLIKHGGGPETCNLIKEYVIIKKII